MDRGHVSDGAPHPEIRLVPAEEAEKIKRIDVYVYGELRTVVRRSIGSRDDLVLELSKALGRLHGEGVI